MKPLPIRRLAMGVTLIELMITIAVLAILASVAAPSFTSQMARLRLQGAGSELNSDLQYARSEAVQRNALVQITFNTGSTPWCYVVHTVVAGAACSCTGSTGSCTPATPVTLKTVSGGDYSGTTLALSSGSSIAFEPTRGMPVLAAAVNATVTGADSAQLRSQVSVLGKIALCSPGGSLPGYPSC